MIGAASSLVALALAVLTALAVNDLAHGQFGRGLLLLGALVVLRALGSSALEAWQDASARTLRARGRASIVAHLGSWHREGERGRGDLVLALDRAAQMPMLERLRSSAAVSLLGVVVIFLAAGWLAAVVVVGLVTLAIPLYQRAGRRAEAMNAQHQARRDLLETRQLEVLQHAPELRALGAVSYGADEIAAISNSEHALALKAIRVALSSSLVTEFLSGVSIGLVAMVVGFGLLDGRLSLVRALIAVLVTSELFVQVRRYGVEFHRREDAERARAVLDSREPLLTPSSGATVLEARDLVTEASDQPRRFTLTRGERLLITGPSGSGKTTLLHTLLGWRAARAGTATATEGPIGYVSVESSLVSGSLRDNLTLAAPLPDDALRAQLRALGLAGPRFEDLDAPLLADGRGLSAGERTRLVLARALLADASLIVLDDVAGVLDASSRDLVRRTLTGLTTVAIVEASVDAPLLDGADQRIELGP